MWSSSPVHIHALSSTHRLDAMHQPQPLARQASHERWLPHGTSGSRTPPPPAASHKFSDTSSAHDHSNGSHRHTHQPAPALAGDRARPCTARWFCCLPLFAGGRENAARTRASAPLAHALTGACTSAHPATSTPLPCRPYARRCTNCSTGDPSRGLRRRSKTRTPAAAAASAAARFLATPCPAASCALDLRPSPKAARAARAWRSCALF